MQIVFFMNIPSSTYVAIKLMQNINFCLFVKDMFGVLDSTFCFLLVGVSISSSDFPNSKLCFLFFSKVNTFHDIRRHIDLLSFPFWLDDIAVAAHRAGKNFRMY